MAKNPGGRQENTKGSKGSFSAGATARSASDKQSVSTGGGGIGGFFSNLFGGGGGGSAPQNRMPDGSRMDTITKAMTAGKNAPNYGQQNLGMAAPGTPGLSNKLALNAAAMQAAQGPRGIMGILENFMPGMTALNVARGAMKHMRPATAFPPRFGPDGQMTPYGMQMQQNSQLLAQQMANQGGDGESRFVSSPESGQQDASQYPQERPAWWPSYLPWPPPSQAGAPAALSPLMPQVPQMGTQPTGSLPVPTPYGTSYSNLQSAISGAQNPLTMGIGGMLRRP